MDEYELGRFYWTSILTISVNLQVVPGRRREGLCQVAELLWVCVGSAVPLPAELKQEQEYLLWS